MEKNEISTLIVRMKADNIDYVISQASGSLTLTFGDCGRYSSSRSISNLVMHSDSGSRGTMRVVQFGISKINI